MYTYKLTLAYEGTAYSGWQIQPNGPSIQEILQNILKILLRRQEVHVIGSGRTDAGVHAKGQIAHFKEENILDLHKLLYSLNGMLPKDIRVKNIVVAPNDFHAQYSAIGKEYHYFLHLDSVMDPFQRLYRWHVHSKVDVDLLKNASSYFLGTHDFTSFTNEAHHGCAAKDPVRTLHRLEVINIEGGIRLEFEGNGFLYKMVRNITGTLIEIASNQRPITDIPLLFEAKDRKKAGQAAPPQGLFLVNVKYPLIN